MESERLYQVQKEDLPKLENLLTQCFREDPLYHSLIPNKDVRERLMPELFKCDLTEFYAVIFMQTARNATVCWWFPMKWNPMNIYLKRILQKLLQH